MKKSIIFQLLVFKLLNLNATVTNEVEKVFNNIYDKNKWGNTESISGHGSSIIRTNAIRKYIPILVKKLKINSILDASCGDFNWMKFIINNLNIKSYLGFDIVQKLVNKNNKLYSNRKIKFLKHDIINEPIPKVDLIICRDCIQHLPFTDIIKVLKNFQKSESTYLLITTFTRNRPFKDIKIGEWRAINFQLPPFNFTEPIEIVNENYPVERHNDKHIGLWRIKDINLSHIN